MTDTFKDIPLSWYAAAFASVTTFVGGIGWKWSGVKAGQMIQKVDSRLETIEKNQSKEAARNSKHFEKFYKEIGDLHKLVAEIRGQMK